MYNFERQKGGERRCGRESAAILDWMQSHIISHCRCSGLAVACLTAVREVLGSNRTVGSCVYRTTTVIYSLGHGLCAPFLQCLGLVPQPSTLRGTVNEYQLSAFRAE